MLDSRPENYDLPSYLARMGRRTGRIVKKKDAKKGFDGYYDPKDYFESFTTGRSPDTSHNPSSLENRTEKNNTTDSLLDFLEESEEKKDQTIHTNQNISLFQGKSSKKLISSIKRLDANPDSSEKKFLEVLSQNPIFSNLVRSQRKLGTQPPEDSQEKSHDSIGQEIKDLQEKFKTHLSAVMSHSYAILEEPEGKILEDEAFKDKNEKEAINSYKNEDKGRKPEKTSENNNKEHKDDENLKRTKSGKQQGKQPLIGDDFINAEKIMELNKKLEEMILMQEKIEKHKIAEEPLVQAVNEPEPKKNAQEKKTTKEEKPNKISKNKMAIEPEPQEQQEVFSESQNTKESKIQQKPKGKDASENPINLAINYIRQENNNSLKNQQEKRQTQETNPSKQSSETIPKVEEKEKPTKNAKKSKTAKNEQENEKKVAPVRDQVPKPPTEEENIKAKKNTKPVRDQVPKPPGEEENIKAKNNTKPNKEPILFPSQVEKNKERLPSHYFESDFQFHAEYYEPEPPNKTLENQNAKKGSKAVAAINEEKKSKNPSKKLKNSEKSQEEPPQSIRLLENKPASANSPKKSRAVSKSTKNTGNEETSKSNPSGEDDTNKTRKNVKSKSVAPSHKTPPLETNNLPEYLSNENSDKPQNNNLPTPPEEEYMENIFYPTPKPSKPSKKTVTLADPKPALEKNPKKVSKKSLEKKSKPSKKTSVANIQMIKAYNETMESKANPNPRVLKRIVQDREAYGENNRYPMRIRVPSICYWKPVSLNFEETADGRKILRIAESDVFLAHLIIPVKKIKKNNQGKAKKIEKTQKEDDFANKSVNYEIVSSDLESFTALITLEKGQKKDFGVNKFGPIHCTVLKGEKNKLKADVGTRELTLSPGDKFVIENNQNYAMFNRSKALKVEISCKVIK